MELIRTKHFQSWLQDAYVRLAAAYHSTPPEKAIADFKDQFYDDANMLTFILNGTYPNTRREGDNYVFKTKDDFIHTDIETNQVFHPGAMSFILDGHTPRVYFDNKLFQHGQIRADGSVKCWGGFTQFGASLVKIGLSGSLMDMYNFARVSNHDTRMLEHV